MPEVKLEVVSTANAAKLMQIGERGIRKRVREGRMPGVYREDGKGRYGRTLYIPMAALNSRQQKSAVERELVQEIELKEGIANSDIRNGVLDSVLDSEDSTAEDVIERLLKDLDDYEPEEVLDIRIDDFLGDSGDYFDDMKIAELLGITPRHVRRRAGKERWPYVEKNVNGTGRPKRLYPFRVLPALAQNRWYEGQRQRRLALGDGAILEESANKWLELPAWKRTEALRRSAMVEDAFKYAAKCKHQGGALERWVDEYREKHPETERLSIRTLYRWREALKKGGLIALAPDWGQEGNGRKSSLPLKVTDMIEVLYNHQNRPTVADVTRLVVQFCKMNRLDVPTYNTIRYHIENNIPEDVKARHRDPKRWEEMLPTVLRDLSALAPNEYWNADHKQLNVAVSVKGRTIFPWITVFQDLGSRAIVGWALCETPARASINQALMRAMRNYGIPRHVIFDNGRDYSSKTYSGGTGKSIRFKIKEKDYQGAFALLGIEPIYCLPPKDGETPPHARGKPVERWFRTMAMFERQWPGFRGENITQRPVKLKAEMRSGGLLSFGALEQAVGEWIDWYNTEWEHAELSAPPLRVWAAHFESTSLFIPNPQGLSLLTIPARWCKVGKNGIRFENQHYWSEKLIRYFDSEVLVRYDPDQPRYVWAFDKQEQFIDVLELRNKSGMKEGIDEYKKLQGVRRRNRKETEEWLQERRDRLGFEPSRVLNTDGAREKAAALSADNMPFKEVVNTGYEELPQRPEHEIAAAENDPLKDFAASLNNVNPSGFVGRGNDDEDPEYDIV